MVEEPNTKEWDDNWLPLFSRPFPNIPVFQSSINRFFYFEDEIFQMRDYLMNERRDEGCV